MNELAEIGRLAPPPSVSNADAARRLAGPAKAAVIVRLLLNEGAELPLSALPDDLQANLTQQMGKMGLVDRATLIAVVQEFAEALDAVGLSFPRGLAGALDSLDGRISPQTAARLRKEAGVRQAGDPWAQLRDVVPEELATMAGAEAPEVAAVLLSKLDVAKAAAVLQELPGPQAREITFAMSHTSGISPQAVDRIGLVLATQLDQKPVPAFSDEPDTRLGEILNQSTAATRDALLDDLDQTDADFASRVRKSIFTFEHLPTRLAPRDAPLVVRAVDPGDLRTALAAATEGDTARAATFLLDNIPARMAENLRDEMQELGSVKPDAGEEAMTRVVVATRNLAEAGEITLISPEELEK